jgi:hypothetical protein
MVDLEQFLLGTGVQFIGHSDSLEHVHEKFVDELVIVRQNLEHLSEVLFDPCAVGEEQVIRWEDVVPEVVIVDEDICLHDLTDGTQALEILLVADVVHN